MLDVGIRLTPSLDLNAWERRYLAGEVPDAWPYGLNRLQAHGLQVHADRLTAGSQFANRLTRAAGFGYNWVQALRPVAVDTDVDLAWDEYTGVPLCLLRRDRPTVTGVIWATDRDSNRSPESVLLRRGLQRSERVFVLCRPQVHALNEQYGIDTERIVHLPFGVDTDFFTPDATSDPEAGTILTAGRDRHRDYATLTAALDILRVKSVAFQLKAAVASPVAIGLPKETTELGRRTHVEMRSLYRTSEVVVVPTAFNLHGSGMTVALEAMACGRPVVATRTPGMEDYIEDGVSGLLVRPGEPRELATALNTVLTDRPFASSLGANAKERVGRYFTTELMTRKLADILNAAAA